MEANEVPNVKVEAPKKAGPNVRVVLQGAVSLASNAGAEFLL